MAELTTKWQLLFRDIAVAVSNGSKDPSTKHGCIIYRPDKTIASMGFNGLPRGIPDTDENLNNRERKYPRIVHAEPNAIYNSIERLEGYGMVVTGTPCSKCALAIIANGIKTVYYVKRATDFEERWAADLELSRTLFGEAGVELREITE